MSEGSVWNACAGSTRGSVNTRRTKATDRTTRTASNTGKTVGGVGGKAAKKIADVDEKQNSAYLGLVNDGKCGWCGIPATDLSVSDLSIVLDCTSAIFSHSHSA